MEQLFELAKNIGALLGTSSVVGYACGYLALRARSFALGTDPTFKLVDQVYVFAGVRFFVITLIAALVVAPVILVVRWTALRLVRALPEAMIGPVQWITLIVVAMMTLLSMNIFSASGLLLREDPLPTLGIGGAVLGSSDGLGLGLTLASVLLAWLSALWLYHRLNARAGQLGWILAVVVALQIFLLPIYHGALFADRRVRVLSQLPGTVHGLVTPVAIVDRTADQATLLGLDGTGRRGLATVALKDLDGIPVEAVMPLQNFLGRIAAERTKPSGNTCSLGVQVADAADATGVVADDKPGFATDFYASLTGYFGIVFESIGSLGRGAGDAGELWTVDLDPSGQPSEPRRVGDLHDLSWPVVGADGASFVALQAGRVVRLDASGEVAAVLAEGNDWQKLLGEQPDGAILALVRSDGEARPARLAPDGVVRVGAAPSTEEKRALAGLLEDARAYSGGQALVVGRSERGGRGFDVFLRSAGTTFNLSNCGDDNCGQASLSPDRRRAVFVRASQN